jgi:glutathione S-transferase
MKLFMSPASPFVRKVLLAACERALFDRIEQVHLNPHDRAPELVEANPLSKVPTLIADDGTAHGDSLAICIYLDTLGDAPPLLPLDGSDNFAVMRRHVWANGAIDALVTCRMESLRPQDEARTAWIARQKATVGRVLDRFEELIPDLGDSSALDMLTLACVLTYSDFRFPDDDWRASRPRLADWLDRFSSRSSMELTGLKG